MAKPDPANCHPPGTPQRGEQVTAKDSGANMDFHSTLVLSVAFDDVAHCMTIVGQGLDNGLPVSFAAVAVDNGSTAPSVFGLTLSDGYGSAGSRPGPAADCDRARSGWWR